MDEEELYHRFARRISYYGLRHLGDAQAAADLVQQVLLIVIESLRAGRVREPDRLGSFVLGTCRWVALDLRRGVSRHERLLERFGGASGAPGESAGIDLDRLRACVEKLPHRERTVVLLSFYAERNGDEIARELGMTAGNVRVVRCRAVGHLKECLGVGEVEEMA